MFHESMLSTQQILNTSASNDCAMMEDLEVGIPYYQPRAANKKMKKRKQLDALLKFRSISSKSSRSNGRSSNEHLLTSEDELFLPDQHPHVKKTAAMRYRRWCHYVRHILSFCFVCIFMIVCVGLAYANIELKSEVQNLSQRVSEIENRFSSIETNRIMLTIDQIKTRLSMIERWNVSYLYDHLQKLKSEFSKLNSPSNPLKSASTEMSMNDEDLSSKLNSIEQKSKEFTDITQELELLSQDGNPQVSKKLSDEERAHIESFLDQNNVHHRTDYDWSKQIQLLNETISRDSIRWRAEFESVLNEFRTNNHSVEINQLSKRLMELTSSIQDSSLKTQETLSSFQNELNQLRLQMAACSCSKEPIPLKPSVVDSQQLQQSIVTKPNAVDLSTSNVNVDVKFNSTATV